MPGKADSYLMKHGAAELAREQLRMVDGRPYHEHCDDVRRLVKAKAYDEAVGLLLRLIEAIEREHAVPLPGDAGVAPWYYQQLAGIYIKLARRDLADEVGDRFIRTNERVKAAGAKAKAEMTAALVQRGPAPTQATPSAGAVDFGRAMGGLVRMLTGRRR